MFQLDDDNLKSRASIKVVGVGGGGGNAVKTMYQAGLSGVEFITANTDVQALEEHEDLDNKIQLGAKLTKGLGAGANPEIGRQAAIESCEEIMQALQGADMVFITAGMGGGTGTGAAGVIARIAKQQGALVAAVVTRPFFFEGQRRARHAETGLQFLKENVDTLIVIPNQKLLKIAPADTSLVSAFKRADQVLLEAVRSIVDLVNKKGLINLDFADVKTIMSEKGLALIGTGSAKGENRAMEASQMAVSSPLLEDNSFQGASGLIINISGGPDLALQEVNQAAELITAEAHPDAEIIFGAIVDPEESSRKMKVTVIATGFEENIKSLKTDNQDTEQNKASSSEDSSMTHSQRAAGHRSREAMAFISKKHRIHEYKQSNTSQIQEQTSQTFNKPIQEQYGSEKEISPELPSNTFLKPHRTENKTNDTAAAKAKALNKQQGSQNKTNEKAGLLPRDILLQKAKDYQKQQNGKVQVLEQPQQLNMIMEEDFSKKDLLESSHTAGAVKLPFKKNPPQVSHSVKSSFKKSLAAQTSRTVEPPFKKSLAAQTSRTAAPPFKKSLTAQTSRAVEPPFKKGLQKTLLSYFFKKPDKRLDPS